MAPKDYHTTSIPAVITIDMEYVYCILQAYAVQIIEDCDKCNEEFLKKFIEAYSLYKAILLAEENKCEYDILTLETTLMNYLETMKCRTCGNC